MSETSHEPLKSFSGVLHPRVIPIGQEEGRFGLLHAIVRIEWLDADGVAIWSETSKPRIGWSFLSQIICRPYDGSAERRLKVTANSPTDLVIDPPVSELIGDFHTGPGLFIDEDGVKHYVMKCDPGRLGALGGKIEMFKNGE